jgi:hypothetical protein
VEFRGEMRSDKFPEEWAEFMVETWCSDRCTRASERSSYECEIRKKERKKECEIIVVLNGDPEHGAQELFFIGEAAALSDTKAGEVGITYTWELCDQETLFGKMCNNDVALDIIKYEPVKAGSNLYERTAKRFPVYVESICVRNVRLEAVGNKVNLKLAQGESNRILLAVPRETWLYREMASRPWDPRLVKAGDIEYIMHVSQELLNNLYAPPSCFVILPCRTLVYRTFSYLLVDFE